MTRIVVSGIVLIAGLTGAGSVLYLSRAGASPAISSMVSGNADKVTLRFFRDPAAVPDFTVQAIDGRTVSSADLRGHVTLVNFWATWCAPCRTEIPDLIALQVKYRDHLQIIGMSEDEGSLDAVKRFVEEYKINYPVVMSTPELQRAFPGVSALPTSFVLDREARVVQKHVGLLSAATTEHETRALAGLPIDATIERVEPSQPVALENAAQ